MKERFRQMCLVTYHLVAPIIEPRHLLRGLVGYPRYLVELMRYRALTKQLGRSIHLEAFPMLHDRTGTTGFDSHYAHLSYWATLKLADGSGEHVDVGSSITWVMTLAALRPVMFLDIRPFEATVPTLSVRQGTVLEMPFKDQSLSSLSCLHVAEHVGLGRYGDPIDPLGMDRAISELARVVAAGGKLYFALPIGRERVCFNAHRVSSPENIVRTFAENGLVLVDFAAVGDDGKLQLKANHRDFEVANYGCGFFEFERPFSNVANT